MPPLEIWTLPADEQAVKARFRSEEGFGLIELLISMVMLNVGILALVAAFNSGALALQRASQTSTASVLADKQLELYRALNWSAITLKSGSGTGSVTTACADTTYAAGLTPCATQEVAACVTLTPQCSAMQTVTGPDGDSYRVDSYIVSETPPNGRAVKRVTVMVRKTSTLKTLAQVTSTFDQSTG